MNSPRQPVTSHHSPVTNHSPAARRILKPTSRFPSAILFDPTKPAAGDGLGAVLLAARRRRAMA
ncbi:MAG: hypothetical protein ABI318_00830 [Chthoniobacteraceae bacterium]